MDFNAYGLGSMANQMTKQTSTQAVTNPWSAFFGEIPGYPQQTAARDLTRRNEDLPYAYLGKNYHLEDVLEGMVSLDNGWPTTLCLPLFFTDNMNFEWNIIKFDQSLIDAVAHEGPSRILRHGASVRSAHSVRRGVAIFFEHDFFKTQKGIQTYIYTLQQLRYCIQRTMSFDVLNTVLNAHSNAQMWEQMHGHKYLDPVKKIQNEIFQFGMIQKDANGVTNMDTMLFTLARRAHFDPDMYIVPPNFKAWVSTIPTKTTTYIWAGPNGVKQRMEGPEGMGQIRGTNTYEVPEFDIFDNNEHISILDRPVLTGEYMTMYDEYNSGDYVSISRDILGYSEDLDRIVKIRFTEALVHSFRFDVDGNLDDDRHKDVAHDMFRYVDPVDNLTKTCAKFFQMSPNNLTKHAVKRVVETAIAYLKKSPRVVGGALNLALLDNVFDTWALGAGGGAARRTFFDIEDELQHDVRVTQFDNGSDECIVAAQFLETKITRQVFERLFDKNIVCPISFLLVRPAQANLMATVILMKGGPETGMTVVGNSNMMLSQDAKLKTIYGHYTFYEKAILKREENIIHAENVFYRGYLGGCSTTFHTEDSARELREMEYKYETQDLKIGRPSIYALMTPYHDDDSHLATIIDITGHFYEDGNSKDPNTAHYESFLYYSKVFEFNLVTPTIRGTMHQKRVLDVNTICVRGHQKNYSGNNKWEHIIENQGHHGRAVYTGCGAIRRGELQEYMQVINTRNVGGRE